MRQPIHLPERTAAEIHAYVLTTWPDLYLAREMCRWSDDAIVAWYRGEFAESAQAVMDVAQGIQDWVRLTAWKMRRSLDAATIAIVDLTQAFEAE